MGIRSTNDRTGEEELDCSTNELIIKRSRFLFYFHVNGMSTSHWDGLCQLTKVTIDLTKTDQIANGTLH